MQADEAQKTEIATSRDKIGIQIAKVNRDANDDRRWIF